MKTWPDTTASELSKLYLSSSSSSSSLSQGIGPLATSVFRENDPCEYRTPTNILFSSNLNLQHERYIIKFVSMQHTCDGDWLSPSCDWRFGDLPTLTAKSGKENMYSLRSEANQKRNPHGKRLVSPPGHNRKSNCRMQLATTKYKFAKEQNERNIY